MFPRVIALPSRRQEVSYSRILDSIAFRYSRSGFVLLAFICCRKEFGSSLRGRRVTRRSPSRFRTISTGDLPPFPLLEALHQNLIDNVLIVEEATFRTVSHRHQSKLLLSPTCLSRACSADWHKRKNLLDGSRRLFRAENETRARGCASDNLAPSMTPQSSPSLSQLPYYRGAFGVARAGRRGHNMKPEQATLRLPVSFQSGKRDSNSRPRPWQGRALPTELFPQYLIPVW